jgi:hypothetical protein
MAKSALRRDAEVEGGLLITSRIEAHAVEETLTRELVNRFGRHALSLAVTTWA